MDDKQYLLSYRPTKKTKIGDREVYCRSLTVEEIEELEKKRQKEDADEIEWMIDVILLGVADKDGNPLFTEEDRGALRKASMVTLGKLAAAVFNFSVLSEDNVEEAEKN